MRVGTIITKSIRCTLIFGFIALANQSHAYAIIANQQQSDIGKDIGSAVTGSVKSYLYRSAFGQDVDLKKTLRTSITGVVLNSIFNNGMMGLGGGDGPLTSGGGLPTGIIGDGGSDSQIASAVTSAVNGGNIGEQIMGTGIQEITRNDPTGLAGGALTQALEGGNSASGVAGVTSDGGVQGRIGSVTGPTTPGVPSLSGGGLTGGELTGAVANALLSDFVSLSQNARYKVQVLGPSGVMSRVTVDPPNPLKGDTVNFKVITIPTRSNIIITNPEINSSESYDSSGTKTKEFTVAYVLAEPDQPIIPGVVKITVQVDVAEMNNLRSNENASGASYGNVIQNGGANGGMAPMAVPQLAQPQLTDPSAPAGNAAGGTGPVAVPQASNFMDSGLPGNGAKSGLLGDLLGFNDSSPFGTLGAVANRLMNGSNGMPSINISIPDTAGSISDRLGALLGGNRYNQGGNAEGATDGSGTNGSSNGSGNQPKSVDEVRQKNKQNITPLLRLAYKIMEEEGVNPEAAFKKQQTNLRRSAWTDPTDAWDFNRMGSTIK